MTWIAPAPTAGAQTEPVPTITVTPNIDLVDGQVVQVTGAGFTPGRSVRLLQCPTGVVEPEHIVLYCEAVTSVVPDATGTFSASAEVRRETLAGDCARAPGICSIAMLDIPVGVVAAAPIQFSDGPTLSETISVDPPGGDHGSVVTVTGENFAAGAEVALAQCLSARVTRDWCTLDPTMVTADDAGSFTTELTIERPVTVSEGVIDCEGRRCVVAAFTADGQSVATADIEIPVFELGGLRFDQSVTVSPEGSVLITGSLWCYLGRGQDVVVHGTITQVVEDRTISVPFQASATCPYVGQEEWAVEVVGERTERFKVGQASLRVRANAVLDPFPDDDALTTGDVVLERPDA